MPDSNSSSVPPRRPGRPRTTPRGPGRPAVKTAREAAVETILPTRYQQFMAGEIKVEDLSMEELGQGVIFDSDGKQARRPPELIPRAFHTAVTSELRKRLQMKFYGAAEEAIDTVIDVMRKGEGEQYDQFSRAGTGRLKAAQEVLNRVLGKVPDKIEAQVAVSPWEAIGEGAELIVDVEVTDAPKEG